MQNDFEKQVQQKMEELNFVPSEPVWTNIEKEIRKKDKRRFLIWLPLFLLFIGGGLYWNYSVKKPVESTSKHLQVSKTSLSTNNTTSSIKEKSNLSSSVIHSDKIKFITSEQKASLFINSSKPKQRSQKNLNFEKKQFIEKLVKVEELPLKEENELIYKQVSTPVESNIKDRFVLEHLFNKAQFDLLFDAIERNIVKTNGPKIVLIPKYKWLLGFEASIGVSNQTSGQQTGDKSYIANSPGAYQSSPKVQSPYTKGFSFSTAVTLTRKLSKSVEFQSGIIYEYLSFNVMVGQHVKHDTILNSFSLDQYYRNTFVSNSQSAAVSNYKNQLHYICVPVKFAFQPFGKVPVRLSAGLLLQQLIHSNMIIYDANSGLYYNSSKSLNKLLLSSTAGFDYSFPLLRHRFSVGPYVYYGLTNTVKTRPGNLYNLNVRASFDIKKFNGKQRF